MTNALKSLSDWYLAQCDGDWEHRWGLSITTLDNPGLALKVNLAGTPLEELEFDRVDVEMDTEDRWYTCWKEDSEFHGAGAPTRIEDVIECFLGWASRSR